jgi:hypothetical protein
MMSELRRMTFAIAAERSSATTTLGRPHAVLREKWVTKGVPWHSQTTPPPPGWNPVEQLRLLIGQPDQQSIEWAKRKNKGVVETWRASRQTGYRRGDDLIRATIAAARSMRST